MEEIKVVIATRHFRDSRSYISNMFCPLAVALKEMFPHKYISVGGHGETRIENSCYITEGWNCHIADPLIEKAKKGEEVETVNLILYKN